MNKLKIIFICLLKQVQKKLSLEVLWELVHILEEL